MSNYLKAVNPPAEGNADDVTAPDPDVPAEFQGKTPAELVKMIQDAQSHQGKQSNEIGQLRQALNQATQPRESEPADEVDWYDDPKAALEAALRPYQEQLTALRVDMTRDKLSKEFPDFEKTVGQEDFQAWVADSSVRVQQFQSANIGDFRSASELLSNWRDLKGSESERQKQEEAAVQRDRKLRAASTEKGAAGVPPGKKVKASDLRKLRQTNPERYREMNAPALYAKGLVERD